MPLPSKTSNQTKTISPKSKNSKKVNFSPVQHVSNSNSNSVVNNNDEKDEALHNFVKLLNVISGSGDNIMYRAYLLPDTSVVYACKKISLQQFPDRSRSRIAALENNLKVIQKLIHPHIVKHYKVFNTSRALYTVMDYYGNGSVQDILTQTGKPLPERKIRIWFAQILGAVSYIHDKGMAHRNIKLTSLLLASDEMAVLSGFINNCLAYKRDAEIMRSTVVGQLMYQAPEMHSLCSQIWPYDAKAADMYALGVCLFQMYNLDPPYDPNLYTTNSMQFIVKQRNRDYHFNPIHETNINAKMRDLIAQLLEPVPGIRISANSALIHEALFPD